MQSDSLVRVEMSLGAKGRVSHIRNNIEESVNRQNEIAKFANTGVRKNIYYSV